MESFRLRFVREPLSRTALAAMAAEGFAETGDGWIECDSMINVRPGQGNRSRGVEDDAIRSSIRRVVELLVRGA